MMVVNRYSCVVFVGVILAGGCVQGVRTSSVSQSGITTVSIPDGAYEFVSDTISLTRPEATVRRRQAPEWVGLWIFQNGYFSQNLMKQRRSWDPFPMNQQDLGFQSSSGTYTVDGKQLSLKHRYTLNPSGVGQPITVEFRLDGDTLTLITRMSPRIEDLSEGEQIIVLRKVK